MEKSGKWVERERERERMREREREVIEKKDEDGHGAHC